MLKKVKHFYQRYEVQLSYASLALGFIIDSLTLSRIDRMFDLLWVAGHLVVVSVALILFNKFRDKDKLRFAMSLVLQFGFGGLLSACFIFFARGATLFFNWPFMILLAVAFIGSEYFKKHYEKLAFQIAFLYFALFSFCIFFVPVVVKRIGDGIFILSGMMSLVWIAIVLFILYKLTREQFKQSGKITIGAVSGIFLLINILYFANLIPPLPLSLKDAGTYTNISKVDGNYILEGKQNTFWNVHNLKPKHFAYGKDVYAYTAIFAPTDLSTPIIHEWQQYDTKKKEWRTHSTITLRILGGRDEGFRTYSKSYTPAKGKWRVNIRTTGGALIGRTAFVVE